MIRIASGLLLGLSFFVLTPAAQGVRDQPPAYVEAARQEAELKALISAEGLTVERALRLASIQERRGLAADAEATLRDARQLYPDDKKLVTTLAGLLVRQDKSAQAIEVLEDLARLQADDRTIHYTIGTYYEELVRKGSGLNDAEMRSYIQRGIAALDRAIALDPRYMEAIAYKNIMLRHQLRLETDPGRRQQLEEESNRLRAYAIELQRERQPVSAALSKEPNVPPPGIAPPCDRSALQTVQSPLRVGGNIKAPTKTRDVRPAYPAEAQAAKIEGVVIIEATINEEGRVVNACVLRSIPLLDDAALQAVGGWEFTPTLLNGAPVPVIMTVTVNFTLQ